MLLAMRRLPANERQRALLDRIADDATPVTRADYGLALTVNALVERGLVTKVKEKGGRWTAQITPDGRYFRQHNGYPTDPPRQTGTREESRRTRAKPAEPPDEVAPGPDGRQVQRPWHPVMRATRDAARHAKRTPGDWIRVEGGHGLIHMIVGVSNRERALRIANEMCWEAASRGVVTGPVDCYTSNYLLTHPRVKPIGFRIEDDAWELQIRERSSQSPVEPGRRTIWEPRGRPSGKLRIMIGPREWVDGEGASSQGEQRIERMVAGIFSLRATAIKGREQAAREAAERARLDALYAAARRDAARAPLAAYRERYLSEQARRQVEQWKYVNDLRAYVEHMRRRAEAHESSGQHAWLNWLSSHLEQADPSAKADDIPPVPDPPHDDPDMVPFWKEWPGHRFWFWVPPT